MHRDIWKTRPTVKIAPAEWYATANRDEMLSTLLGSCVAACLYDRDKGIFGMNHFMLSNPRYARNISFTQTEAGRYGIQSMELLINDMMKLGARRKALRAKVFGGGSIITNPVQGDNFSCVGQVNSRFIIDFCKLESIPLDSSDLGGVQGRVIYFDCRDQAVYLRKIRNSRMLAKRDHDAWQSAIYRHQHEETAMDIWL